MKRMKMSLANIEGRLSRTEMKNIMAGSGGGQGACSVTCGTGYYACCCAGDCKCHSVTDSTDYGCTHGGKGSTMCSVE